MKEICERRDYYRYSYMDWTTWNDITLNWSWKTPSYPNFSPNYNTKETSRETIYKLSIRKNDGSYEELIVSQQDWLEINNWIKCQIKVSLISGITIDKILECINN